MDGVYPALSRQSGLSAELATLAQNVANAQTTGYRAEAVIFAEHVARGGGGAPSLSMAHLRARTTDWSQGPLEATGGALDLAVEGDGFFQVQGPDGPLLTRAGAFALDPDGALVTHDGLAVLDGGGAPVQVPPGAGPVHVAPDGTMSADGRPFAQIGPVRPDDLLGMRRVDGTRFVHDGAIEPAEGARVMQGFLEGSNASPIHALARLVEVQNAYQMGRSLLDREDERLRAMLRLMDPR